MGSFFCVGTLSSEQMDEFFRVQNSEHAYQPLPRHKGAEKTDLSNDLIISEKEPFGIVQEVKTSVSRDKETKEPVTVWKESDICFVYSEDERNSAGLVKNKTIIGFIYQFNTKIQASE